MADSYSSKILHFYTQVAMKKPESIINTQTVCPFCRIDALEDIYEKQDPIIWLKNKFPTLKHTLQTVIIETDECHGEMSNYSPDHMIKVFRFAVQKWMEMENSQNYRSVILFKNHGALSGGTIRHPHMQIIGLEDVDYRSGISPEEFTGDLIESNGHVTFSIATQPMIGFTEFDVVIPAGYKADDLDQGALYTQTAIHFLLNHFHRSCHSYNLFFYEFNGAIFVRIIPRFVVTPLYVGYKLQQISDNHEGLKEKIKTNYFNG